MMRVRAYVRTTYIPALILLLLLFSSLLISDMRYFSLQQKKKKPHTEREFCDMLSLDGIAQEQRSIWLGDIRYRIFEASSDINEMM